MKDIQNFDPLAWAAASGRNSEAAKVTNDSDELTRVKAVVDRLMASHANIAESYDDWFRLGMSLADGLSEAGRDVFHQLSAQSAKYREAECEKQWQECMRRHDGRISIATFYDMARQAGVNLSEVNRLLPPTPPFRQDFVNMENGEKEWMNEKRKDVGNQTDTSLCIPYLDSHFPASYGGGGVADMAETTDVTLHFRKTFSDRMNMDDLPPLLRDAARMQDSAETTDMALLGILNLVSGFMPHVSGIYDKRRVFTPFYTFIVAPSGTDKGMLPACKGIVDPIIDEVRKQNNDEQRDYRQRKAQYDALAPKERAAATEPEEPPYRCPLIAVNASATAFYSDLAANNGRGAIFETEADTVTQAIKQDYGDYSSGLRKAFHHEDINYSRRKDHEHVYISNPCLSALITCTPGQVPLLLSPSNMENGMANRFVFYFQTKGRGWRNVFEDCEETLGDRMKSLGQRFKALYDDLQAFEEHPLLFTLSEEQKASFNAFFEPLYNEQVGLYGHELDAFVKRLGLTTYRIAMVLTVLRGEERQPHFSQTGEPLVCCNVDFCTAIAIADCLIAHTAYVYYRLLPHRKTIVSVAGRPMSVQEQAFLETLPEEFTRKEYLALAASLQIPERTAERYVGNLIKDFGVVDRIGNGRYRKTTEKA